MQHSEIFRNVYENRSEIRHEKIPEISTSDDYPEGESPSIEPSLSAPCRLHEFSDISISSISLISSNQLNIYAR